MTKLLYKDTGIKKSLLPSFQFFYACAHVQIKKRKPDRLLNRLKNFINTFIQI